MNKGSYLKIVSAQKRIIGYTTRNSGGVPKGFKNYFVIEFDHDFTAQQLYDGKAPSAGPELAAEHAVGSVSFRTRAGEQVQARGASSFISPEQAERNLQEIGSDDFETVKAKGRAASR